MCSMEYNCIIFIEMTFQSIQKRHFNRKRKTAYSFGSAAVVRCRLRAGEASGSVLISLSFLDVPELLGVSAPSVFIEIGASGTRSFLEERGGDRKGVIEDPWGLNPSWRLQNP
mmetsp:Transcript_37008/g.89933  ORF Transcript_37008/g.89933 Transcript_37008/m.89933 type:complete len:113 (-) Transcript_37008:2161-2499(-)